MKQLSWTIYDTHKLAEKILKSQNISNADDLELEVDENLDNKYRTPAEVDNNPQKDVDTDNLNLDASEIDIHKSDSENDDNSTLATPDCSGIEENKPKLRRKRRTELENLEIDMKGWNIGALTIKATPFINSSLQYTVNTLNDVKIQVIDDSCGVGNGDEEGQFEQCEMGDKSDDDFNCFENYDCIQQNVQLYLL